MTTRMMRETVLGIMLLAAALMGARTVVAAENPPVVSYDSFHDRLAGAGTWHHDPRWGDVWRPNGVTRDFRPYFDRGHWVYTADYGWFWDADDPWGDIVFHYGRWVFDPAEGWIWLPGYVWAPAWVYWRFGDGFVGWMPAAPDPFFFAALGIGLAVLDWGPGFYGYAGWYGGVVGPADLWFFVGGNHFADTDFRRFAAPRAQAANLIARTRNVTRFTTVHGVVANRSIRASTIARLSGHAIRPMPAHSLLHGNPGMTSARAGRIAAVHEHAAHPVPASRQITTAHRGVPRTGPRVASHAHPRFASHRQPSVAHHGVVHGPSYAHTSPRTFTGGPHAPVTHGSMTAPHPAAHGGSPPRPQDGKPHG